MNAGGRLDDAIHGVVMPAHLLRPAVPAAGLRRARVHRAHRLAAVRRLVGRQPGQPQACARSARWRPRSRRWPAARGRSPTGRWRCSPTLALARRRSGRAEEALRLAGHLAELAWLAAPGDRGIGEVRREVYTARAEAATSTMAKGVFRWAARESLDRPLNRAVARSSPRCATRHADMGVTPIAAGGYGCHTHTRLPRSFAPVTRNRAAGSARKGCRSRRQEWRRQRSERRSGE